MNDRIKELSEQSGVYYNDSDYDHSDLEALQKFAELIIKECAHVALMSNGNNLHVFTLVKEHFGVEE